MCPQLPRLISIAGWVLALGCGSYLSAAAPDFKAAREHWAYQPLQRPPLPPVRGSAEARTAIDRFILQKLEANALGFSPPAPRRTLVRRAYVDLIGLPPTHAEIEAFAQDDRPDAFARLIDRLLALPQYGERWGRHWLDVARYADTKDLVLQFGKDRLRPFAYTYRDYVIRAFNEDTPFDRFVEEQLAADQIEPAVDRWRLAALGFLTLGRLYDNNPHDQIDDQIDTVSRGFLGLTVACARCHDHKYDAIPTDDYYSLYGVFASSERPHDLPLIEDPATVAGGAEFEKKWAEAKDKLDQHIDAEYGKLLATARDRIPDYLERIATTEPDLSETSSFFLSLSPEDLRPGLVNRWRRFVNERSRREDPVFGPWSRLVGVPAEEFAVNTRQVLGELSVPAQPEKNGWNALILHALAERRPTNAAQVARAYGEVFRRVLPASGQAAAPAAPTNAPERQLLELVGGTDNPGYFPREQTPQHMSRVENDKYNGLVAALDKLAATATNRPPARAMVVRDARELMAPRIFVRGSPSRPGRLVPRAFLQVLSRTPRAPFAHGSGRLDLARAIAATNNPLTARVIANRIWMHHLGEPLVNSPSDFGTRSEAPAHPELLDYLAWTLVHDLDWSLKRLHRLIMLSRVYQQASADQTAARQRDPDNRWLWRAHRRRLELEAMRDTFLFVSGRLDYRSGGPAVEIARDASNARRTVYGLVDRQDLPPLFRAFDFICPDQSIERRPRTTVPQQALFVMNSAFIREQARALVARPEIRSLPEPAARTQGLYRLALGRDPTNAEAREAEAFVRAAANEPAAGPWEQLAHVLLMTNELLFVD